MHMRVHVELVAVNTGKSQYWWNVEVTHSNLWGAQGVVRKGTWASHENMIKCYLEFVYIKFRSKKFSFQVSYASNTLMGWFLFFCKADRWFYWEIWRNCDWCLQIM